MKKIFSPKYWISLLFPLILAVFCLFSLKPCYYSAYHILQAWRGGTYTPISAMETDYADALPAKNFFITLNGGFQRLLGLKQVNTITLLNNGYLTYTIPETDITAIARETVAFRDTLAEMGIPFAYINTPFKLDPQDKQLPAGVEDYSDVNIDRFLAIVEEGGVNVLDLRQSEKEQGLDHYSLYFVTDHHWTAEAGFWAYTQVVDYLASLDESFRVSSALTDIENYDQTVYEDIFLGSSARRVGPLYAGSDDLTVITPKFDTRLRFEAPVTGILREGGYEDTVLFPELLTKGTGFDVSRYNVYCGDEYAILKTTNFSREQGLDITSQPKKLLMLKDSMSSVVIPYLALSYDEICFIDLRLLEQDLTDFIAGYQPDMVAIMYNPGALEAHNHNMFVFDWK